MVIYSCTEWNSTEILFFKAYLHINRFDISLSVSVVEHTMRLYGYFPDYHFVVLSASIVPVEGYLFSFFILPWTLKPSLVTNLSINIVCVCLLCVEYVVSLYLRGVTIHNCIDTSIYIPMIKLHRQLNVKSSF